MSGMRKCCPFRPDFVAEAAKPEWRAGLDKAKAVGAETRGTKRPKPGRQKGQNVLMA